MVDNACARSRNTCGAMVSTVAFVSFITLAAFGTTEHNALESTIVGVVVASGFVAIIGAETSDDSGKEPKSFDII